MDVLLRHGEGVLHDGFHEPPVLLIRFVVIGLAAVTALVTYAPVIRETDVVWQIRVDKIRLPASPMHELLSPYSGLTRRHR